MRYTRTDLIKSYLEARRYSRADNILADDVQRFTTALQRSFDIPLADFTDITASDTRWPLALVFRRGVEAIQAQDTGVLEEGLLYTKLEQSGEAGKRILHQYMLVGESKQQVTAHAMKLLADVLHTAWPTAPLSVDSNDLSRQGFDDSNRPDPMDFW